MIVLRHEKGKVSEGNHAGENVIEVLYKTAKKNPAEPIIIIKNKLDASEFIDAIGQNPSERSLISNYNPLNDGLGYVEDSPFINVSNSVKYPTWIKGSNAIYIHSSLVNKISHQLPAGNDLLYWVNSVARLLQSKGVLCYQIPMMHQDERLLTTKLYQFVKQHYKRRWTFFLLACHLIYEKRFPVYAFAKAQFYKRRNLEFDQREQNDLSSFILREKPKEILNYDVIIPTMGRPKYLYDVLNDLSDQTILPVSVIIIEQNENPSSTSQLSYLKDESWPFAIIHNFIHQTGACNARNMAIDLSAAPWVLFFDDDVNVSKDLSNNISNFIKSTHSRAVTFPCLQEGEEEKQKGYFQWAFFGSGCSIVHRDIVNCCKFDPALEHGYGEDVDYGMQIRNSGFDIIYAPEVQIRHLKAPSGGFRSEFKFPWQDDTIQPKPSPHIMYFRKKSYTQQQLLGYKLVLALKLFSNSRNKNPWKFIRKFKKQWESSAKYASRLIQTE
ncbi:Glycosyltransferase, GT2 family [Nonlabens sp. Hel1_33_55]|uniref:glycosyltransferase family 2 protein n=1 Tax=Nonlabens sp. Hel1_33_55 TaxID=1336802 RepID=UPI000875E37E|nr:glycosyltransferase [Nonlabens sp. Hel1_33_55]SCX92678.1 Glycosyltransferase, GT2 family [Nonlabens sp. Hel1_33_55]